MATRCFWPPESCVPFSPTTVSYPCNINIIIYQGTCDGHSLFLAARELCPLLSYDGIISLQYQYYHINLIKACAMATRCFWPPESCVPFSPTTVSYPCNINIIISIWSRHAQWPPVVSGRPRVVSLSLLRRYHIPENVISIVKLQSLSESSGFREMIFPVLNYFYGPDQMIRSILFLSCLFVCRSVCLSVVNFKIHYNFWTVRERGFIFGMHTQLMMPFQTTNTKVNNLVTFTLTLVLNIVAAFRGMHVSPAKHSYASVTDGQTDGQTDDGQSDPYVSLCFAGDTKIAFSDFVATERIVLHKLMYFLSLNGQGHCMYYFSKVSWTLFSQGHSISLDVMNTQ